jgi:hypothetical protein
VATVGARAELLHPRFAPVPERGDDSDLVDTIDVKEVQAALKKCKSSSARDEISYAFLKRCLASLLQMIATLSSICLTTGYFTTE